MAWDFSGTERERNGLLKNKHMQTKILHFYSGYKYKTIEKQDINLNIVHSNNFWLERSNLVNKHTHVYSAVRVLYVIRKNSRVCKTLIQCSLSYIKSCVSLYCLIINVRNSWSFFAFFVFTYFQNIFPNN